MKPISFIFFGFILILSCKSGLADKKNAALTKPDFIYSNLDTTTSPAKSYKLMEQIG